MSTQGNIHFFTNWSKERLDEMDATLTSLQGKAAEVQADVRDRAAKVLAELTKNRDAFRDAIKQQAGATEAAWATAKTKMEADWIAFEAEVVGERRLRLHPLLPQSAKCRPGLLAGQLQ